MHIRNLNVIGQQRLPHAGIDFVLYEFRRMAAVIIDRHTHDQRTVRVLQKEYRRVDLRSVFLLFFRLCERALLDLLRDQPLYQRHIAVVTHRKPERHGPVLPLIAVIDNLHGIHQSVRHHVADGIDPHQYNMTSGHIENNADSPVFHLDPVADLKGLVQTDHQSAQQILDRILRRKGHHRSSDSRSAQDRLPDGFQTDIRGNRYNTAGYNDHDIDHAFKKQQVQPVMIFLYFLEKIFVQFQQYPGDQHGDGNAYDDTHDIQSGFCLYVLLHSFAFLLY